MNDIRTLWHVHRGAGWPSFSDPNQGELMTLDTVISGCVTYYLESESGLDPQRIGILEDCLVELDDLLPGLADEAGQYFERLQKLGTLLLNAHQRR